MVFTPLLAKSKVEYLELLNHINVSEDSSVNHALTHVAKTVTAILQHVYPIQVTEPEHRQLMLIEPLSLCELQVLQLIVDGDSNFIIAQKLYIAEGAVESHVRNILRKLCVSDRTQAAVRALQTGLVH